MLFSGIDKDASNVPDPYLLWSWNPGCTWIYLLIVCNYLQFTFFISFLYIRIFISNNIQHTAYFNIITVSDILKQHFIIRSISYIYFLLHSLNSLVYITFFIFLSFVLLYNHRQFANNDLHTKRINLSKTLKGSTLLVDFIKTDVLENFYIVLHFIMICSADSVLAAGGSRPPGDWEKQKGDVGCFDSDSNRPAVRAASNMAETMNAAMFF